MSQPHGEITLVDNQVPALTAGQYSITVHQEVSGEGVNDSYLFTQPVSVLGPHFAIDAGTVHAVYPPGGSTADYTDALASISLSRAALPWLIPAFPDEDETGPSATPWLMLLLLTPEEVVTVEDASPTGAHPVPLSDYLTPRAGIVGPGFTAAQVARFERDHPEGYTTLVVDVRAEAFTATAPTLTELPHLAHGRDMEPADGELSEDGVDSLTSVVIGNRLARGSESGIYLAHLVSVEGFTSRLPPFPLPDGATTVRLVSLASWTFNGTPGAGNFAGLVAKLDVGPLLLPTRQPGDPDAAQQLIGRAVKNGYIGVDYQTRFGEDTVCWYRGPALPVRMEPNRQPAYATSAQALLYDQDTGMFDVSYAVAWESGRMALLSNRSVTLSLLEWLRRQQRTTRLLFARLGRTRAGRPSLSPPNDPADLLAPRFVSSHARRTLAEVLNRDLTSPADPGSSGPQTGPGPPRAKTGPAPEHPSPLAHPMLAMSSPTARSLLQNVLEPLPDDVTQWLAQLVLLSGLPFTTVVPDSRMLPAETIRFFHLDQNWTTALVDGALSVVDQCGADTAMVDLHRRAIHEQVRSAASTCRTRQAQRARAMRDAHRVRAGRPPSRATAQTAPPDPPGRPWSGFLLRSAIIADWPGLTVTAYEDTAGTRPLSLLRLEKVAPTVLIGIAGGQVQQVRVAKPPTTLHFGVVHVDAARSSSGTAHDLAYLRGLGGRFPSGHQLPGDPAVEVPSRPDTQGRTVLDVNALQVELSRAIVGAYHPEAPPQEPPVPPAAFGLQLVAGAETGLFIAGTEQRHAPHTPAPAAPPTGGGQR